MLSIAPYSPYFYYKNNYFICSFCIYNCDLGTNNSKVAKGRVVKNTPPSPFSTCQLVPSSGAITCVMAFRASFTYHFHEPLNSQAETLSSSPHPDFDLFVYTF